MADGTWGTNNAGSNLAKRSSSGQDSSEVNLPDPIADAHIEMTMSPEAEEFLEIHSWLRSTICAAEALAKNSFANAKLSLDVFADASNGREYLCVSIEPAGNFSESLEKLVDFRLSLQAKVGKQDMRAISFSLI